MANSNLKRSLQVEKSGFMFLIIQILQAVPIINYLLVEWDLIVA